MPDEEQDTLIVGLQTGVLPPIGTSERERALVAYAERLTMSPAAIGEADITRLRDVGLDDDAIHDACAVTGYFAFVNRIADGLGVELETTTDRDVTAR